MTTKKKTTNKKTTTEQIKEGKGELHASQFQEQSANVNIMSSKPETKLEAEIKKLRINLEELETLRKEKQIGDHSYIRLHREYSGKIDSLEYTNRRINKG